MRGIMLYFAGLSLFMAGFANTSWTMGAAGLYLMVAAFG